jgi:Xaa-Pro aminopeptidase
MDLSHFDGRAFSARRTRLAERLGNRAALIPAGAPRARTAPGNAYYFRASSHFLYLFGLHLPRAYGLWDGDSWQLFVPEASPDAALWHGKEPGPPELSAALGCPVLPTEALANAVKKTPPATLPALDGDTRSDQASLLGRPIAVGKLDAVDAPLADAMIDLRLVHDEAAIAQLRMAAQASGAAHRAGMAATRPGIRESTVRAAMEAELISRNIGVSYNSIVTVHGEILHNEQYHHLLSKGDLLLADVGAETAEGWAGDITRTWPVSGRFSSTQRDFYNVVLRAQMRVIDAVRPGDSFRELHFLAGRTLADGLIALGVLRGDPDELLADGVVALLFPHGLGHLLGLDVHDMEEMGDRATYAPGRTRSTQPGLATLRLDRDLVAGMAVTIEPGLYQVPGILNDPVRTARAGDRLRRERLAAFSDVRGIRIEDDILVTVNGREVLTADVPKTPEDLEATLSG